MIIDYLKIYLKRCVTISEKKSLKILLSFHQTSNSYKKQNSTFYSLPPRIFDDYLIAGFCNLEQDLVIEIAKEFNKKIAYFLVDLEKKGVVGLGKNDNFITGNLEGRLEEIIEKEKILGIRFDSLTAEHVVNNLIKENPFLYKRSISIIGLGKIGFKIAMSLLECGNNIEIYSRDYKKTFEKCTCMEILKPPSTLARPILHREIESCLVNKDIIITTTNSKEVINNSNCKLLNKRARIISVGHGELSNHAIKYFKEKGTLRFSRVDIGKSLITYVKRLLDKNEILPKRKKFKNKYLVSGGYLALPGDYIVDDADNPKLIFGFVNDSGKFNRELDIFDERII